jgi:hypothetical protein
MPIGAIIVNGTQPPLLAHGRLTREAVRRGLAAAGLDADREVVGALVEEARGQLARQAVEADLRRDLVALGRPLVELPLLTEGVRLSSLYDLAGVMLRASGAAAAREAAVVEAAQ